MRRRPASPVERDEPSARARSWAPPGSRGTIATKHAASTAASDGDAEDAGVERDLVGAHREARGVVLEDAERGVAEAQAEHAAEQRRDQRLDQELDAQRLLVGPQRGAQRELVLAPRETRQRQVGDVGARDQQHERRGAEQDEERRPSAARELGAQRRHRHGEALRLVVGVGVLLVQARGDALDLGAGLLDRDAGLEAREDLGHPVQAVLLHGRAHVVRAGDHVGVEIGLLGIGRRRLQHADDGDADTVHLDLAADHVGVGAEEGAPEAIGQHRDAGRVLAVVRLVERAPEHRMQPEDVEVVAGDHSGPHPPRLVAADHVEGHRRELGDAVEALALIAIVGDLGHREQRVVDLRQGRRLPQVDQTIAVGVRQRPQQHAVEHAEDRGVGPDPEAEREDERQGVAGRAGEAAKRELHVVGAHRESSGSAGGETAKSYTHADAARRTAKGQIRPVPAATSATARSSGFHHAHRIDHLSGRSHRPRRALRPRRPACAAEAASDTADIPRTASGRPDLSGNYDLASLTPMQRNAQYGERRFLTKEEAEAIEKAAAEGMARADSASDPNREAPAAGGDGSGGAAGGVGGYNAFWVDPGTKVYSLDGKYLASIINDPPDGRVPPLTAEGKARRDQAQPLLLREQQGRRGGSIGRSAPTTAPSRCRCSTAAST